MKFSLYKRTELKVRGCELKRGDWISSVKHPKMDCLYQFHAHSMCVNKFLAHPIRAHDTPMVDLTNEPHHLYFDEWEKSTPEQIAKTVAKRIQGPDPLDAVIEPLARSIHSTSEIAARQANVQGQSLDEIREMMQKHFRDAQTAGLFQK